MELRQRVTKRYLTVVRTAPPNANFTVLHKMVKLTFHLGKLRLQRTTYSVPGQECPQVTKSKLLRTSLVPKHFCQSRPPDVQSPKLWGCHTAQDQPSQNSTRPTQHSLLPWTLFPLSPPSNNSIHQGREPLP